jgi:flagellar FliJ protein
MKPFRFTLQALLTLRRGAEQVALEKYAGALLARRSALETCEKLRQERSHWWAKGREALNRGCSAAAVERWRASDRQLSERSERAEAVLAQAEVLTNQTLQNMLLARRDREAVEKHLLRQRSNYTRELNREEQKLLDDLATRHLFPLFQPGGPNPSLA